MKAPYLIRQHGCDLHKAQAIVAAKHIKREPKMLKIFAMPILATLMYMHAHTAFAANIEPFFDQEMGCSVKISGEIADGDLKKLTELFEKTSEINGDKQSIHPEISLSFFTICLDSPGGNFPEAVKIAEWINKKFKIATAVPKNSKCESACAIIFMTGHVGASPGAYRILHPTARLGFHAPSLSIPTGNYSKEEVQKAFEISTQASNAFIALMNKNQEMFPPRLLEKILNTPADDMYYIDTIGEAAAWNITVAPVDIQSAPKKPEVILLNIFANIDRLLQQSTSESGYLVGAWSLYKDPTISKSSDQSLTIIFPLYQGQYDYEVTFGNNIESDDKYIQPSETRVEQSSEIAYLSETIAANRLTLITTARSRVRYDMKSVSIASAAYLIFDPSKPIHEIPSKKDFWISPPSIDLHLFNKQIAFTMTCGFPDAQASITNVQNFTNLRRESYLQARIIGRVPLGASVKVRDPGRYWRPDRCAGACNGTNQNAIKQCIDNNDVWIEVQYNGRRGFLSRKFLK